MVMPRLRSAGRSSRPPPGASAVHVVEEQPQLALAARSTRVRGDDTAAPSAAAPRAPAGARGRPGRRRWARARARRAACRSRAASAARRAACRAHAQVLADLVGALGPRDAARRGSMRNGKAGPRGSVMVGLLISPAGKGEGGQAGRAGRRAARQAGPGQRRPRSRERRQRRAGSAGSVSAGGRRRSGSAGSPGGAGSGTATAGSGGSGDRAASGSVSAGSAGARAARAGPAARAAAPRRGNGGKAQRLTSTTTALVRWTPGSSLAEPSERGRRWAGPGARRGGDVASTSRSHSASKPVPMTSGRVAPAPERDGGRLDDDLRRADVHGVPGDVDDRAVVVDDADVPFSPMDTRLPCPSTSVAVLVLGVEVQVTSPSGLADQHAAGVVDRHERVAGVADRSRRRA